MNIHLLGDSIVKSYGDDEWNFIGGWGDHFKAFLADETEVYNYALGGRSTRSFLNEGRFEDNALFTTEDVPKGLGPALPRIQPGDYVFLQFGHNDDDSKDAATRVDRQVPLGEADGQGIYPAVEPIEAMRISSQELSATYRDSFYPYDSGATYKGFLKYYIKQIRQKGACPILVTSAVRLTFHGKVICPEPGHHGGKGRYHDFPYVEAVRQLGREEQVPVLDLFAASKKMQEMLGPEDATYMQSIKDAQGNTIGEVNYNRPEKWPEEYNRRRAERDFGSVDNTHQNRIGSFVFAALLIELMHEQHILEDKLRQVPTKQVPIPEKLLPRKKDIAAMFHYVKLF